MYIDSNVIISFLEGTDSFQKQAEQLFEFADQNGVPIITSEITVAECLYGAHRLGKDNLVKEYEWLFLSSGTIDLVPITIEICQRAAKLGAEKSLKLIDALHFASAQCVECDVFITNDRKISSSDSLLVLQLVDVSFSRP